MKDMETMESVYQAFFDRQLDIRYDMEAPGDSTYDLPNLRQLILATTMDGEKANFLATDRAFATVKEMHRKNLIVPVVGDFAGEKALRGISDYLRSHDATISPILCLECGAISNNRYLSGIAATQRVR